MSDSTGLRHGYHNFIRIIPKCPWEKCTLRVLDVSWDTCGPHTVVAVNQVCTLCCQYCRWNTFGETRLQSGETMLFSGKENEDDNHEN
ncbi:hypothetical protein Btru_074056 [Bulinus truncatus]|nr:hypothetical protein Btru_074056 [Bulinus truncatus]